MSRLLPLHFPPRDGMVCAGVVPIGSKKAAASEDEPRAPNYRVVKDAAKNEASLYIYDDIGASFWGGIGATQVKNDLEAMGKVKTINVHINSNGGDVFEGRAIYSQLVKHGAKIITHVDGLAASIASLIAMAGSEIRMAEGTFIMIHNAWGFKQGSAEDMRQMAALLDGVTQEIRNTYIRRTNAEAKAVKKWMDDETWFTAAQAKENGFCDYIDEPVLAAAKVVHDLRYANGGPKIEASKRFKHIPASLQPRRAAALAKLNAALSVS